MSDQDNLRNFDELRNRIAYILESHSHMPMDQQACAIIDELGLQVLEVDRIDLINGTVASYQIIGKWEH